jgi:hypothetical protein
MCALDGPVYVCYEWPYVCVLWVTPFMCDMGGPVYVFYGWPCICMLWVALYMCTMYHTYAGPPIAYIYRHP